MTWLNSLSVTGHAKRILHGNFVKIHFLLLEYWLSFSLCNLFLSCGKNQYLLLYSTIKHKSMFQKLRQKHGTSKLGFHGHSSLPDGSGCMSASFFMTAGGVRCVLFMVSSWLELGWMWASNIYVHKIHSSTSTPVGWISSGKTFQSSSIQFQCYSNNVGIQ